MYLYQCFINSLYALCFTFAVTTIVVLISSTYDIVIAKKRKRKFLDNLTKELAKELEGINHDTSIE